jgi:two-component system invasion response regulator UvrY
VSRLYLVDDHAIVREGLRGVLVLAGHEVVGEAADPAAALDGIRRLSPELVLVDIQLGARSGIDLLRELRQRGWPVRCIVLSMSAQPRHVAEALRAGAQGYVLKGSPSSDLLAAIDAVTAGRTHLGADVAPLAAAGLASQPGDDPVVALSPRERQIVMQVVRGKSSAAIAEELHLSPKTVETYRSRLMAKIGVGDTPALVRWAIRHGLVDLDED